MNRELIQGFLDRACYDQQDQNELEDWCNVEKLAQMIVRECVGIVARRKDQAIDDGWNVDEAMTTAEMDLLEHFGVEL
jgi:hypothetical protein